MSAILENNPVKTREETRPGPLPAEDRLEGVASIGRHMLEFFGSLKLAMVLLAILIGACIIGTVLESRLDTAVAQAYVYDAPWFIAWLVLLCMNLICSALVRYPWKPHLTGFVITHAGIVTVLVGAIIGRIWGVEGNITLFKGEAPINYIVTRQKLLEIRPAGARESVFHVLPVEVRAPTPDRPLFYDVEGFKISVLGYAPELGTRTVVEEGAAGVPAIHVVMQSAMVPKPIEHWLVLDGSERSRADLGPAVIRLAAGAPPAAKKDVAKAKAQAANYCREVRYAFAKMPEMGVTRSLEGPPSGVRALYRFDRAAESHQKTSGVLELGVDEKRFEFPVGSVLGKSMPLKGTPWTLKITRYYADFRLNGKEAVSASDHPENPAVMFEISGKSAGPASAVTAAQSLPHGASAAPSGKNTLTIYRDAAGALSYEAGSIRRGTTTGGAVELGREFSPGWADWKVTIDRQVERAIVREELAPVSAETVRSADVPGIEVRVQKDGQSAARWIGLATPALFRFGDESIQVAFGPMIHPLGFGVVLDEFTVDRDEGSQNPAGFTSQVRFVDPADGADLKREISMNRPANFPDYPGVGLLGTTYKFSQASWNPNDLNQTTLQVLRDPGWSLKWIGSLMVCAGIFTMFYIKPYMSKEEVRS